MPLLCLKAGIERHSAPLPPRVGSSYSRLGLLVSHLQPRDTMATARMPALYINHGGGPMPLLPPEMDRRSTKRPTEMYSDSRGSQAMRDIANQPSSRPTAILIVSAHWEEHGTIAVSSAAQPPMVYDYGGFPPETYQYQYHAPGSPQLAQRVQALIQGAGHHCRLDGKRGFDHGVFVPMMLAYPDAEIPVVSVSLQRNLDPSLHYSVGEVIHIPHSDG